MTLITYMPGAEDNDTTSVSGITFVAYVPTDVPDAKSDLIAKLSSNPSFTAGTPDASRKAAWAQARGGAVEEIEQLEENIEREQALIEQLSSH